MSFLVDITASLGLKIRHDNLRLIGSDVGYTAGLDGRAQAVFSENRVWRGSIEFPPMFGKELAELRSVPTRLRGRVGVLRVPILNVASPKFSGDRYAFLRSLGLSKDVIDRGYIPFSDGSVFSDGSGFSLPDTEGEFLSEPLEIGARAVKFSSYVGRNLAVGDRFSISAKLYEVEENDDGRVKFSPPARRLGPAGAEVRVSEPHVDLKLLRNEEWDVDTKLGFYSEPLTVNVVEAFDR